MCKTPDPANRLHERMTLHRPDLLFRHHTGDVTALQVVNLDLFVGDGLQEPNGAHSGDLDAFHLKVGLGCSAYGA